MALTSWSDLLAQLRKDWDSDDWTNKSYSLDGVTYQPVSAKQVLDLLKEAELRASKEFTSWSNLLVRLRNDLYSGNWISQSYAVDGVSREFRSVSEFMALLQDVERRASMENLSTRPLGRTYGRSAS
jgi:hypothetical protein